MSEQRTLRHLGIIMDGNRRWAKNRGVPVAEGHRQGYKNLKNLLRHLKPSDIEYVSVYAFSTENWDRSKLEVDGLMKLLRWVLKNEVDELTREERRIVFVGSVENVPSDILKLTRETEERTKQYDKGTLAICFNYGGQQEIVDAVKRVNDQGGEVTPKSVSDNLYHPEIPKLDLIIRTSGEKRISNYMLWRAAYAELAFTDTLWPDLSETELDQIIADYRSRKRRFGK